MMTDKSVILIVDDTPLNIQVLTPRLLKSGYDVLIAENGADGIRIAKESRPDLILLDLNLPGMNGFMVCRILKFDANFKNIPIIMFTALKSDADKWRGLEVGADAYLTKPVDLDVLVETIREMLN